MRQRISQNISTDPEDAHNIAVKKALLAQLADGGAPVFENLLLYVYRQEQNFPLAFDFLQGKAKRGDFRPGELLALGRSAFEAQQVEQSHEILTFLIAERRKAPVMGWLENALRLMLEVKQEYGGLEDARTFAGKFSSGSCYPCFLLGTHPGPISFSIHPRHERRSTGSLRRKARANAHEVSFKDGTRHDLPRVRRCIAL